MLLTDIPRLICIACDCDSEYTYHVWGHGHMLAYSMCKKLCACHLDPKQTKLHTVQYKVADLIKNSE